jgi:phosphatidylglycerol:prolipoprotein diacylglycerol transferase
MHPELITVFGRPIYWYGVMTALGFLAAVANWAWLGRREGREKGLASELGIWVMAGGILGARVAYVLANWPEYAADPLEIIRIDKGGLIFYGGFIGGALGIVILSALRKEPLWAFADFVVTSVPLGHALGRIGCLLNGCCFGKPCDLPWAVSLEDVARHPTPLYEAGYNLAVYALLLWLYPRRKRDGGVFIAYLLCYPVGRFLLEFTRGDPRMTWLGLTVAQEISIALFAAGCALWLLLPRRRTTPHA